MRFHVGFSFRFKAIKKFLIPFLVGLLSYFGFSYFNILVVNALANFNTYFNLIFYEQDYSTIQLGDYTMKELLDEFHDYDSEYYNIVSSIYYNNTNYFLTLSLVPKNVTSVNNNYIYSQFKTGLQTSYNNAGGYSVSFSDLSNQTNQLTYQKLITCLDTNVCDFNDNYTSIGLVRVANSVSYSNDNIDYNVDVIGNYEYLYVYSSQVDLIYYQYNAGKNHTSKAIKVNDIVVNDGDSFITYCDLYDCDSSNNNESSSFDFYLLKEPYIYSNIDISNISNYEIEYSYYINGDSETYIDNLLTNVYYYGRVNHSTYYSYDELHCTSTKRGNLEGHEQTITINNFNCTETFSNYDKFYVSIVPRYIDDSIDTSIYNFVATSNGFITHNTYYMNYFVDDFTNLSSGFKVLLSSNNTYNNDDIYIQSNNDYVGIDYLPNSNLTINTDTNGDWLKNLPIPKKVSFGNTTNKTLMLYDDISYSNVNFTNLYLYLKTSVIVSFDNNDSYSYYDDTGNIVNNNIYINYDNLDSSSKYSSVDQYFIQVNNFIDSLESDMLDLHNLLQSCYDSLDISIQTILNVLYVLVLTYLAFKVAKR